MKKNPPSKFITHKCEQDLFRMKIRKFLRARSQQCNIFVILSLNKNKEILDIIDQTYSEIKNKHEGRKGEGFRSPKIVPGVKRF